MNEKYAPRAATGRVRKSWTLVLGTRNVARCRRTLPEEREEKEEGGGEEGVEEEEEEGKEESAATSSSTSSVI